MPHWGGGWGEGGGGCTCPPRCPAVLTRRLCIHRPRSGEIWGDLGRSGEIWGDLDPHFAPYAVRPICNHRHAPPIQTGTHAHPRQRDFFFLGLGVEAEGEATKAAKARKRAGLSGGLPAGHKWVETSSKAG